MHVCIDIECNSLNNPTQIWLIVCKDIDTGKYYVFRNITTDEEARKDFLRFSEGVHLWIGHNLLGYDWPVIVRHTGLAEHECTIDKFIDTLITSKLVDYSRVGHSIEHYGIEFGLEKGKFSDWSKWSQAMEEYCFRDVDICHLIYTKYRRIIDDPSWHPAIDLEHRFQLVVNNLHSNGFGFNHIQARKLLDKVEQELKTLDKELLDAFPSKLKPIREITPKVTKFGTLSRTDFRWLEGGDLSEYNGGPFTRCGWHEFNPSSHKQLIDVLTTAGWSPVDKTETHKDADREYQRLRYRKQEERALDLAALRVKLETLKVSGWKINENNLSTLPSTAPPPARLLAKRILYESRRRTLTEWIGLCGEDGRVHGKFYGIGAWTHRMAHQQPNTANIPNEYNEQGKVKLLGKELRSLWCAPRNRLLVGVDAEGIQLRIFAHYIDEEEFTYALVNGRKENKTDPHSLNQRVLGSVCKTRQAAKRFVYALLLGAGLDKLAEILECSVSEARAALDRLLERYQGFARLKQEVIPKDARRGFFIGLDGRHVLIPGDTDGARKHLCMSGYLQNGEAIVMKRATLKWEAKLKEYDSFLVDLIHDEWQTETPNDMDIAISVAKMQANSLKIVGEELGLRCPLAGSYWNDDKKDYTIGTKWTVTH